MLPGYPRSLGAVLGRPAVIPGRIREGSGKDPGRIREGSGKDPGRI
jgi:hypothetical protein